jgi:hypothetical protein
MIWFRTKRIIAKENNAINPIFGFVKKIITNTAAMAGNHPDAQDCFVTKSVNIAERDITRQPIR